VARGQTDWETAGQQKMGRQALSTVARLGLLAVGSSAWLSASAPVRPSPMTERVSMHEVERRGMGRSPNGRPFRARAQRFKLRHRPAGCTLTRRQPLIAAYAKVISSTTLRGSACQNHSLSSVMTSSLPSDLSLPHVLDHRTGRPDDAASALDFVVQTEGASKRRPRR
jgi:hypothetical protein